MKTLHVSLGTRSYPIYIGNKLLASPELLATHIKGRQVLVVSNDTVAPLYLDRVLDGLQGYDCDSIILPDGEQYKTLETTNQIYTRLLEKHFNRDVTLIALGGGVIGDITGFAAASYQRGVAFIQIPTTLLAQVDSSVGGKTGVNHPLGKNMIGAFHQPNCVIADTATLDTLDDRQLSAGLAEIIKYGLIREPDFLAWLRTNMGKLVARDNATLIESIERSCQCKAEVVAADETEQGIRAILNLGHTFGHAIETAVGYGNWLHGEAVAVGMLMAADLSRRLGWLTDSDTTMIREILQTARLPVAAPATITNQQYLDLMSVDKKVIDGRIRLVLLKAIGQAVITDEFDPQLLAQTLDAYRTEAA